jgi:hypothetical protein
MANIMKPWHISQAFGLDSAELDFFDANLRFDSKLFIDPFLIKRSPIDFERSIFNRFNIFFRDAYRRSLDLGHDESKISDLKKYFNFIEPREISLGYTETSNRGAGLGPEFARALLDFFMNNLARTLVVEEDLYPDHKFNPLLFTIFADKLGPDGISDLSTNLMMDYLIEYTKSQAENLNIQLKILPVRQTFDFENMEWTNGGNYYLPENPLRPGEPIIFVPKRLLRADHDLIDKDEVKSRIVGILKMDPDLSQRFARILSNAIKDIDITEIQNILLENHSVLKKYFQSLESQEFPPYDFSSDILGFLSIVKYQNFFNGFSFNNTGRDECEILFNRTKELVSIVKNHLESSGWRDLWRNADGKEIHQKEEVFGRIFRGMGLAYFKHFPAITFDAEVDLGIGKLDFRVLETECNISIEIKNLCNASLKGDPPIPSYLHGIERQLPAYTVKAQSKYAFYITAQHYKRTRGPSRINHDNRANEIRSCVADSQQKIIDRFPAFKELVYENFDVSPKRSASNI